MPLIFRLTEEDLKMETKSIFVSKTFWVNIIAVAAMTVQGLTGKEFLSAELQLTLLGIINIVLRTVTKSSVNWN